MVLFLRSNGAGERRASRGVSKLEKMKFVGFFELDEFFVGIKRFREMLRKVSISILEFQKSLRMKKFVKFRKLEVRVVRI